MKKFIINLNMEMEIDMNNIDKEAFDFVKEIRQKRVVVSNVLMDMIDCENNEKLVEQVDITEDINDSIMEEA